MKHTKKITILHSNDLHGDFLAEQVDEKLVGGVSMLSGYIEKVRAEEPNTIYAIAGDMFRGSVIDSEYKGLSTIEIMNALAPDIVTIGNHEVDYGIAHLLFIEKCARFPIINANLYIKNTPTRLFTPYKILRVDGMNILFIGIITEDLTVFNTPEIVDGVASVCETLNYHYILSNLRFNKRYHDNPWDYPESNVLVRSAVNDLLSKQVAGIIYIGCHSHLVASLKAHAHIPFVCVYCTCEDQDVPCVGYDDRLAAYEAGSRWRGAGCARSGWAP